MSRFIPFIIVPLIAGMSGCVAIGNVEDDDPEGRVIYGGTISDAGIIGGGLCNAIRLEPQRGMSSNPRWESICFVSIALLELPFSFVVDTFTLPITVHATYLRLTTPLKPPTAEPPVSDTKEPDQ